MDNPRSPESQSRSTHDYATPDVRHVWPLARVHLGSVVTVILVASTFLTNARVFGGPRGDSVHYREMAAAAPDLPAHAIGSAYTGRFVPHYLVGLLADVSGLSLSEAYVVGLTVVLVALIVTISALVVPASITAYVLYVGILVSSPYFIRPYIADPASFQDLVFVLGTAVCLFGLLRRRSGFVIGGLIVAILGRQTALLTAPVAAMWVMVDPPWRGASTRRRWLTATGAVAVVAVLQQAVVATAAPFTVHFEPHIPDDTVLTRLDELPDVSGELVAHAARTFIPLAITLAVIIAGIAVHRARSMPIRWAVWGSLLMAAAIVVQPLAIDPAFPGFASNEQRLSALALVPLAVTAGLLLAPLRLRPVSAVMPYALIALLVLASLHHTLSRVGPPDVATFVVLQLIIAGTLALAIYQLSDRSDATTRRDET